MVVFTAKGISNCGLEFIRAICAFSLTRFNKLRYSVFDCVGGPIRKNTNRFIAADSVSYTHLMLMYEIGFVFLLFLLYSVIGWACETVWCSVGSRKFVNRGFLNGPLCPIYGFGALAVLYLLRPFTENLFTVFLAGIVMTSFLEYVTGYLLERLFHLKLWDYSNRFCNINGRVCLRNSLLFGMMSVLLVWFIHPFLEGMLLKIPRTLLLFLSLIHI